jgi:hypothetical protein
VLASKPDGAAENSPQHISAPFIARHRAIRQRERQTARMIRHHSESDVVPQLLIGCLGYRIGSVGLGNFPEYLMPDNSVIFSSNSGVHKSVA